MYNANIARTISLHRPNYYGHEDPSGILFNRHFNKGTAFTLSERTVLGLRGLLPPVVEDIETQVRRCLLQLRSFSSPISQYNYLSALRERSDTLFYRLLIENLQECLPLIYTPTVGQACLEFGGQYRSAEGMYFSASDKGQIRTILNNWRANLRDQVAIIVLTDGSRILGLGDLGANGMGIPIGKLSLYVAAGGFHPASTLPIVLDTGTNNTKLVNDEFYLGARHPRLPDKDYYPLLEELLESLREKWPHAVVQFEDFSNDHCFEILSRYRQRLRCFNDDIQGTGGVIAAGFLAALEVGDLSPMDHRFVFLGAGSAGIGVAQMIIEVLCLKFGYEEEKVRELFYLVDSKGLITVDRGDELAEFKKPYARKDMGGKQFKTLEEVVKKVKPTGLVGLSGQGGTFTENILKEVTKNCEHPIVFALSNPTKNAECTAEEAYKYTDGKVIFASGSPFPPVRKESEKEGEEGEIVMKPSQGNNMYIFPGIGLGSWLSRAAHISDGMILEAAVGLADLVSEEEKKKKQLYPPLSDIRSISSLVASHVIKRAVDEGVAAVGKDEKEMKENLVRLCEESRVGKESYHEAIGRGYDWTQDPLVAFVVANMYHPKYLELHPTEKEDNHKEVVVEYNI